VATEVTEEPVSFSSAAREEREMLALSVTDGREELGPSAVKGERKEDGSSTAEETKAGEQLATPEAG
jgi:hypothetical protein